MSLIMPQVVCLLSLALLKPGEKLVIVNVEPLVISDPNFLRKEVWAQVGRCDRSCDK